MSGNRLRARADSVCGPPAARAAAWTRIAQLFSACARDLRRAMAQQAAACDLTDTEYLLLFVCRETADEGPAQQEEGLAQQDIAEALGVSPGQVSGLVDRLQQRGLVQPHRLPHDRRRQLWTLTDQGRQLLSAALVRFDDLSREFDRHLPPRDRERIEQLVAGVRDCIRAAANSTEPPEADGRLQRKAS